MHASIKDKATLKQVESLAAKLRRRQLVGSHASALETVLLLRQVVSSAKFTSIEQLLGMIRGVGRKLVEAQPKEHSVGNIVRKVLRLIREEYYAAAHAAMAGPSESLTPVPRVPPPTTVPTSSSSLANFVLFGHPRLNHPSASERHQNHASAAELEELNKKAVSVKPALIAAIQEVIDELETVYDNVSKNARDHIHSDEIVLTIGNSRTVEAFLKSAAHYRRFTVMVAETAPSFSGRDMAGSLASAGISTVLVPDSCIFAVMSRVNKVILGAHAILANGGMFSIAGTVLAATAAKAHSTPVVIVAGQFKLTPLWNLYHEHGAVDFGDPGEVLRLDEGDFVDKVDVVNPFYDYVKPELVDVLVTNDGDHPPSYVYRLIKETYDDEDIEL